MVSKKPQIIDHYSLCTIDCEKGEHIGEWIDCDRCGAPTHVNIFEIDHPQHGVIKVGKECFKDVMGFNFTKSHEKALATLDSLIIWADEFDQSAAKMQRPPEGEIVALGLPGPLTGYKHIPVWMKFSTGRFDNSHNWDYSLRSVGARPHPLAPFGFSKSIVNAGLDMGLWDYVPGSWPNWVNATYMVKV